MSFLLLLLIGFAGVFAHWAKRYGRGQIGSSFADYMQHYHRQSIASLSACCVAVAIIYWRLNGMPAAENDFIQALLAGYVGDSVLNKDKSDV